VKAKRKPLRQRSSGTNAFEMLAVHLKVTDDAAWYAERLERLGTAMFGELWRSDESNSESEALDTAGCEHLDTSPYPLPDRGGEGNNS
jgi:hypothetical protein